MDTITIDVVGMTCKGCVASVTRVLSALPGVRQVDVVLESGKATVQYEAGQASRSQFEQAIRDAGFSVEG